MIITIVFDQFSEANNGTTMTARRFAEALAKRGNEVRILGGAASGSPILKYYETGTVKLFRPVRGIFEKQGMIVSKINKEIIKKACDGADIVHFLIGFKFERYVKKYCDKHHIPTCSAFHCQPENITSTIYLGHSKVVNDMVYRIFRSFYDKFEDIHCPSKMIADQLKEHHYKGTTHVISNGVSASFWLVGYKSTNSDISTFVGSLQPAGQISLVELLEDGFIPAVAAANEYKL